MPTIKELRQAITKCFAGVVAGWLAAGVLIPFAYRERGYYAVGGEFFLILLVGFAGWFLCHLLILRCVNADLIL